MISQYFTIQELVPSSIYSAYGERSWMFLDREAVEMLNQIREFIGVPITVNNWATGGTYELSGFRPPDTSIGGKLSQHKFGRAFDLKFRNMTAADAHRRIRDDADKFMSFGLTTIEDIAFTPTWVHIDCRITGQTDLLIVKPLMAGMHHG